MSAPIIGLVGPAQSGKDSIASSLCTYERYRRMAFADKLKEVALSVSYPLIDRVLGITTINDIVRTEGWERAKQYPEVRKFLQDLGVGVRSHLGEDAWAAPVVRAAKGAATAGRPVVVTDVRFENELALLREAGALIVRVSRPGIPRLHHVSEHLAWTAPDSLFDAVVVNDGTVAQLSKKARKLARWAGSLHDSSDRVVSA